MVVKMFFKKTTISLTVFCLFSFIIAPHAEAAWNVWLDHSIRKYRQDGEDGTNGSQSHSMKMARNEFESFQVFVYADDEPLNNVDVSVSNFTKGDDSITNIYLYKEHYIDCSVLSRPDYETGYYPDALLPKVDRFYNETRNTFPFDVSNGKVQGVWIDVGTESITVPGIYTATVTISTDGKTDVQLPVTLEVFNFALPSTATYESNYILIANRATYGHGYGENITLSRNVELMKQYIKLFLYHRASWKGTGDGYSCLVSWDEGAKKLTINNWTPWESFVSDAMNGTAITSGPYAGAKFPMIHAHYANRIDRDSPVPDADKQNAHRQYLQLMYDRFDANGWEPYEKMYVDAQDEPRCDSNMSFRGAMRNECDVVRTQGADANSIDTHGKGTFTNIYIHTHNKRDGITDFADYGFYSPNFYSFACNNGDKTCSKSSPIAARDEYVGYPNDRNWPYLACDNNGCDSGMYPSLASQLDSSVDAPSMYNRLTSFVMWKYEGTGTFFWGTNVMFYENPYLSVYNYGSNGDGQLLYPGIVTRTDRTWSHGGSSGANTPAIGGNHDIPIASIRWKYIRDWNEDLEYMQLAKNKVGKDSVDTIVDTMFTNIDLGSAYWFLNMDPDSLINARQKLAQLVIDNFGTNLDIKMFPPIIK